MAVKSRKPVKKRVLLWGSVPTHKSNIRKKCRFHSLSCINTLYTMECKEQNHCDSIEHQVKLMVNKVSSQFKYDTEASEKYHKYRCQYYPRDYRKTKEMDIPSISVRSRGTMTLENIKNDFDRISLQSHMKSKLKQFKKPCKRRNGILVHGHTFNSKTCTDSYIGSKI